MMRVTDELAPTLNKNIDLNKLIWKADDFILSEIEIGRIQLIIFISVGHIQRTYSIPTHIHTYGQFESEPNIRDVGGAIGNFGRFLNSQYVPEPVE